MRFLKISKIALLTAGLASLVTLQLHKVALLLYVKSSGLTYSVGAVGFLSVEAALLAALAVHLYSLCVSNVTFSFLARLANSVALSLAAAFTVSLFSSQADLHSLLDTQFFTLLSESCLTNRVVYFENTYNECILQRLSLFRGQDFLRCSDALHLKYSMFRPLLSREFFIQTDLGELKRIAIALAEQHSLEVAYALLEEETPKNTLRIFSMDISRFFAEHPLLAVSAALAASFLYFRLTGRFTFEYQEYLSSSVSSYKRILSSLAGDSHSQSLRKGIIFFEHLIEDLTKENSPEQAATLELLREAFPTLIALVEEHPNLFSERNLAGLVELLQQQHRR